MNEKLKKNTTRFLTFAEISALTLGVAGCNRKVDEKVDTPPIYSEFTIDGLNVRDEESIEKYASKIQMTLAEHHRFMSLEDVVLAIKLANINMLDNQKIFDDISDLQQAVSNLGVILEFYTIERINKHTVPSDKYINEDDFKRMFIEQSTISDLDPDHGLIDPFYKREYDERYGYNKYVFMQDLARIIKDKSDKYSERGKLEAARLFVNLVNQRFAAWEIHSDIRQDQVSYIMLSMFIELEPYIHEILKDELDKKRYLIYSYVPYGYSIERSSALEILERYGRADSFIFEEPTVWSIDVYKEKEKTLVRNVS